MHSKAVTPELLVPRLFPSSVYITVYHRELSVTEPGSQSVCLSVTIELLVPRLSPLSQPGSLCSATFAALSWGHASIALAAFTLWRKKWLSFV